MLSMPVSLLKTRRRLVVKVGDSTWLAARLDKLLAYCGGQTNLRGRCNQTAPLLEDVGDAWTSSGYKSMETSASCRGTTGERLPQHEEGPKDKLNVIMGSICSHCHNHCTACVYDCQIRYDNADEGFVVNDLQGAVDRGMLDEGDLEFYHTCVDEWDQHRPLKQTMTASCELERTKVNIGRGKCGNKGRRRKDRVVFGGEKVSDPKWPAVLLTFERGVSESFKEKYRAETWF